MLHKNMLKNQVGFRALNSAEIEVVGGGFGFDGGDEGPEIIVTGDRDIWTFKVFPEDWLNLGMSAEEFIFGDRLGVSNQLGDGSGQNEGGSNNNEEEFDPQGQEVDFIGVNDDGEGLERVEDTIEQALEELTPADWAVQYNEKDGKFYAQTTGLDEHGDFVQLV